jgi:hypothetical protein
MRESYKDYEIGIIQESENSWKAKIARKDGNSIRLKYGDGPVSSITTGARHSEKDAFDEAKSTIDGGRMDRGPRRGCGAMSPPAGVAR